MIKKLHYIILLTTFLSCQTIVYHNDRSVIEPNEGFVICKISINQPGWEAVIFDSETNKLVGSIKDIWSPSHLTMLKLKQGTYIMKYLRQRGKDMTNEPLNWKVDGDPFTVYAGQISTTDELSVTISMKDELDKYFNYEYRDFSLDSLELAMKQYPELFEKYSNFN